MSRKIDLSIACLIDDDIAPHITRSVTAGDPAPRGRLSGHDRIRVKYDASVILALGRIYREVKVVTAVDRSMSTITALSRLRPDVVFNLAFSSIPPEAPMVGCLDLLGIPYTGSGALGIALSRDKILSRHLLAAAGVRVPRFAALPINRPIAFDLSPPLIVKPASLSGSVGISARSVVGSKRGVAALANRIWQRHGVPAICEEFVVGREFRVALVEAGRGAIRVAGATEWHFGVAPPGWGFRTEAMKSSRKAQQASQVSRTVVPTADQRCAGFAAVGRRAMEILDVRGYATMDLRVDGEDRVTVLELNANPGIWAGGSTWGHPSFEVTLKRIVDAALRRAGG